MMESEINVLPKVLSESNIDPTQFDLTVSAFLVGLGAGKYIDTFRKQNIGQITLIELSDEDLVKLGVDDANIRKKIIDEIKNLPIFEELSTQSSNSNANLGVIEIADILEESSQHLYRIYLSMLANTLALRKTKIISDCLLYEEKYASNIALSTLSEVTTILNSMDIAIHTKLKVLTNERNAKKKKKIIVGTVGSAAIIVLSVLFARSLKQL